MFEMYTKSEFAHDTGADRFPDEQRKHCWLEWNNKTNAQFVRCAATLGSFIPYHVVNWPLWPAVRQVIDVYLHLVRLKQQFILTDSTVICNWGVWTSLQQSRIGD